MMINDEVLIIQSSNSTLYIPSTISETTVNDFIDCNEIMGNQHFIKKEIKRVTSADLQVLGHRKLKDQFETEFSKYLVLGKEKQKYVPAMRMSTTRIGVENFSFDRISRKDHIDSVALKFLLEKDTKKFKSNIYKSINSDNFKIDVNRDYNKKRIDFVSNESTFILPHEEGVKPSLHIVNIESYCYRRYEDQVYYNHYFEFYDIFDSCEHMDKTFVNIREATKYYKNFLHEWIINDKFGWVEFAKSKLPEIEEELNKDEHWKDNKEEYNGYWEY